MALFITFEGSEGSGKSVQARALYRKLSGSDIPVELTHEPGGTQAGEKITRLLKWTKKTDIKPLTELLLFNASRSQLINQVIRPALDGNKIIICDRYTDSTIAYQSYARGLNLETVKSINAAAAGGLTPDMTILLDLPVEIGFARKQGQKHDRFEQEDYAFHEKVRAGYLKLAAEEPERWVVIDATQPKRKIKDIIWRKVSHFLENKRSE